VVPRMILVKLCYFTIFLCTKFAKIKNWQYFFCRNQINYLKKKCIYVSFKVKFQLLGSFIWRRELEYLLNQFLHPFKMWEFGGTIDLIRKYKMVGAHPITHFLTLSFLSVKIYESHQII
jgi:hypothetical protein